MSGWTEAAAILGFFVLRLGVPLGITLLDCYFLCRLDMKWQAEAEERRRRQQTGAPAAPEAPKPVPCWVTKGCPQETYRRCPSYLLQALPCWLARLRTEGRLPVPCSECALFRSRAVSHAPTA